MGNYIHNQMEWNVCALFSCQSSVVSQLQHKLEGNKEKRAYTRMHTLACMALL
jgi:hypothetical protein